jgi:hypothetical protein
MEVQTEAHTHMFICDLLAIALGLSLKFLQVLLAKYVSVCHFGLLSPI